MKHGKSSKATVTYVRALILMAAIMAAVLTINFIELPSVKSDPLEVLPVLTNLERVRFWMGRVPTHTPRIESALTLKRRLRWWDHSAGRGPQNTGASGESLTRHYFTLIEEFALVCSWVYSLRWRNCEPLSPGEIRNLIG
eukprot:6168546-Pyramimonas_sp.AAC.1